MKQALDKLFNMIGLVILSPLMLIVAAAGFMASIIMSPFVWVIEKLFPEDNKETPMMQNTSTKINVCDTNREGAATIVGTHNISTQSSLPSVEDETGRKILMTVSKNNKSSYIKDYQMIIDLCEGYIPTLICYSNEVNNRTRVLCFFQADSISASSPADDLISVTSYKNTFVDNRINRIEKEDFILDYTNNKYAIQRKIKSGYWRNDALTLRPVVKMRIKELFNGVKAYLRKKYPTYIDKDFVISMDWKDFESWIADLLNQNGWEAYTTSPVNDGGKDIIAIKDNIKYFIECKHWKENSTIGRELLQKLIGAAVGENVNHVIFITTSQYHDNAIQYAQSVNAKGNMCIDLWDIDYILNLANQNNGR